MERFFVAPSLGLLFSFSSGPSEVSLHVWIQNNATIHVDFSKNPGI